MFNMNEQDLNDKWHMHEVIQEALKSAHLSPSPETTQRLKTLENNHNIFMEKLDKMSEQINKLSVDMANLPEKIFEKADERYASKIFERAMYTIIGAIGVIIIGAVLNLILK